MAEEMNQSVQGQSALVFGKIPLNSILPSRFQMRKVFDEEYIAGLAESIKVNGLQVPIKVWRVPVPDKLPEGIVPCTAPDGSKYCNEQIYGECRVRSAKLAGLTDIDALTAMGMTEKQAMVAVAIENVNRKDLHFLDEAGCFKVMLDGGLTQVEIAKAVGNGRTPNYIYQSLKILELAEPVKEKSRRRDFSRSNAMELTRLPKEQQEKAFDIAISREMSMMETRKLVDRMLANPGQSAEEAARHTAGGQAKNAKTRVVSGFKFQPKAGKGGGTEVTGFIPDGMSEADADKVFGESLHNWNAEHEAKLKEAQDKKTALEAAAKSLGDKETAFKQASEKIEHLESAVKSLEKAGSDAGDKKREVEELKKQQKTLADEIKELKKTVRATTVNREKRKVAGGGKVKKQNGLDEQETKTILQTQDFVVEQIKKNMEQGQSNNNGIDGGKKDEEDKILSGSAQDTKNAQADKLLNDPKEQKKLEEQAQKAGMSVEDFKKHLKKLWGL
jgi:ParB family chromosome partitioning protein